MVTIFVASMLTEAKLLSPVLTASPLLKRTFSMANRDFPLASNISTSPS